MNIQLQLLSVNANMHHLDPAKTPSPTDAAASESSADSAVQNPPAAEAEPIAIPTAGATKDKNAAYRTWRKHDLALQTWLAASNTKPYQNKILLCTSFYEAWTTIEDIFSATSKTRVQGLKSQLRGIKKT
ncbi:hypothetical protein PIB30_035253 [Stylosanthes scabra]|uniref:Uncharacterized protein n=1 Tax=Stylosanthes scabra TaxID=79078 RepID=A0ABU6VBV9_9FABA|nr:hypothetical protein [Stylosanthes scabra]